jgi:hypothetical protein
MLPSVRGFNYFNNNPSILILISKLILSCYFNGRWGTNYFADIIELKTGIKTRLGNASTGNPDGKSIFCNENGSR